MKRLLYVSRSRLPPQAASEVDAIAAAAAAANARLGVTGGLIWTGEAFAQLLEGDAAVVDALMADIALDPRHESIRIVAEETVSRRTVPEWSMAYAGRASYVGAPVEALLKGRDPHEASHIRRLMDLVREFAA